MASNKKTSIDSSLAITNPKPDNIVPVDVRKDYMESMARYSFYILYDRFVPSIYDGLKPVHRRIIYCMWNDVGCVSKATKRKSTNTVGRVIGDYSAHSDQATYDAFKPITNWFECKCPLLCYDSQSGTIQGDTQAHMRYTESYLSPFSMDVLLADLIESRSTVDWAKTFDGRTVEPVCLPVRVPLLLVNGSFAIAIGERVEIPPHSLNDVIDITIKVLHDSNTKVVLIPDPCDQCEIVETDWKKICNQGMGYFIERSVIQTVTDDKGSSYLSIRSTPDLVWVNDIMDKIEELVKKNVLIQISDMQDHSTRNQLDVRLYLKRGADPEYVKQVLYKHTQLQVTKRVNFQVIVNDEIKRISYKAYILSFIEFRRNVKFRLYNARLQKIETRYHTIEIFIAILESGDVENIIHAIRNQNATEEQQLVEWLMKKLKITPVQAQYILNIEIKRLSKSNLSKYKQEQAHLIELRQQYIKMLTTPELIDKEIEQELLDIKAKYGKPRRSIIISQAQASNIPQGTFKVIVYENATIKKIPVNDPVKSYRGINPKCVTIGENDKDLLLFDDMGKVFRLPIYKIGFTDKNAAGIDVRLLLKNLTSNIVVAIYLPVIEALTDKTSKYFLVSLTKGGLIKRIDLDDIISTTPSGLLYSKLNQGDSICDIALANYTNDIIVYTKAKALRLQMDNIPYLKRATLGNLAMKSNEPIDGMAIITKETSDLAIITRKGFFNRISPEGMNATSKTKAGSKVIKLSGDDEIKNIFSCTHGTIIRCYHTDGSFTDIETASIQLGSTISTGNKLTKEIVKAQIVKL